MMIKRLVVAFFFLSASITEISAQTGCTQRNKAALLEEFRSCADRNLPPGCSTAADIRDLICSVPILNNNNLYIGPTTDWVNTFWPNTTPVAQLMASNISGGYGIIGAAQTSSNVNADAIAMAGFAYNNNISAVPPVGAWGGYFEADRASGINTPTQGVEIDVGNNGGVVDVNPYAMHPNALNVPLWIGCGGAGFNGLGGSYPCSLAIGVVPNTQPYRRGIVLEQNALDPSVGAGGNGLALELAAGQSIKWTPNNSDTVSSEVWGGASGLNILCDSQSLPISGGTKLSICTNLSGFAGEINIINASDNGGGVNFLQKTGGNSIATLATADLQGLWIGGPALATTAVGPFLFVPAMAGAPTGVPADAAAGRTAVVNDSLNHRLCWYEQVNSAWKCVTGN
jgi:hypothetical protein